MRLLAVDPGAEPRVEFTLDPDGVTEMRRVAVLLDRVNFDSSGCWLWQGWIDKDGYGQCQIANTRKKQRVHRYSYELLKGPIPEGLVVHHRCRVRNCLNPNHLEAITVAHNTALGNAERIQRYATHCKHGHLRSPGKRCAECNRVNSRRHYAHTCR